MVMQRLSNIVDSRGQPIKVNEALHEDQTSKIGYIGKEYENHPSGGLTPAKLASILRAAEQGDLTQQADLFEDMEEKDGHISCEMGKRKRALLGLYWDINPPKNPTPAEIKAAEQVKEWLEDMEDLPDYIFDIADAIGKAYSMLEINWKDEGGMMLPILEHKPARWFTVDEDNRNKLLLRNESGKGDELWPFGWVQHVHKSKSGYVARGGLGRVLAWPYLFKNYSIRDLAEFCEIYGIPARIGTYPSGASEAEKMTLLRAVVSIGHNAAGIMPEGMMMDFKEAAKGASDPFQFMINWSESVQSKVILGGTLTSTAQNTGLGSNLGDIHNEVRHDLMISDAYQIAGTLTRDLIWPMVALNISGIAPNRAPRFKFITDEGEELNARAERDEKIFNMGFQLTPEKVVEVYGEGYVPIAVTTNTAQQNDNANANNAATSIAAAKVSDNQTELGGMLDQLTDQTQPSINQLLDGIKKLLDEVESLEEFQNRLVEAYNYLDPEALADIIQLGLGAADLAGRYEVTENG
tara:strand:- start:49456 stop:51021 length:1566 start_codon:yes stop_codon:yes gene_type:complete